MHHLGHHGQRLHGARADAGRQQQLRKIGRPALGRRGERAVQAASEDVARAHVVMRRHDEMRQLGLRARALPTSAANSRDDAVRTERAQQIELRRARVVGAAIGQIDDLALARAVDRAVRLVDEACEPFANASDSGAPAACRRSCPAARPSICRRR